MLRSCERDDIMTESSREYAMELLATMVMADKAEKENRTPQEVFSEFRKSDTFAKLFDPELELWIYISDEYDMELAREDELINDMKI